MGWLTAFTVIYDYHTIFEKTRELVEMFNYKNYYSTSTMFFYIFAKTGFLFFSLVYTNPYIALAVCSGYVFSKFTRQAILWATQVICEATGISIRSLNKWRAKEISQNNFQALKE